MSQDISNADLVFYTNPQSRGNIVHWMLEEIGRPYTLKVLEYGTTMKAPEYLAVNPMGKVPALRHGGTIVTEAAAICAYLAEAFPKQALRRRQNIAATITAGSSSPPAAWSLLPPTT